MNQFDVVIDENKFTLRADKFDSTGAYKKFYAMHISNGFSIYAIHNDYILFFIELGEVDNKRSMHVNYYVKYSTVDRTKIISDESFIYFISSIAYYFEISKVILYADYMTCDVFTENNSGVLIQRGFAANEKSTESKKSKIADEQFVLYGGSYCVDFYVYLTSRQRRYQDSKILSMEISPQFSYYQLDLLKKTDPDKILSKTDNDELYQIYDKTYRNYVEKKNNNLADFLIWIIEHKCYLVEVMCAKMERLFKKDNLFNKDYYILDPTTYLYNRNYIDNYPQYVIDNETNIKRPIMELEKNMDPRIIRSAR